MGVFAESVQRRKPSKLEISEDGLGIRESRGSFKCMNTALDNEYVITNIVYIRL